MSLLSGLHIYGVKLGDSVVTIGEINLAHTPEESRCAMMTYL